MTTRINKFLTSASKMLSRYGWMLAIVLLYGTSANAQEKALTLQDAIKLGVENSKTLKLSQSKIDQAVSEYNQAKDRALPTGSASFMYSRAQIPAHNLNFGENGLHLPSSANANLGIANLSETIFAGGKLRYARESTDLLVQVARLDVDNNKDQIVYDIINEYYGLYKVLQSQKVVQQNITSVDQQIHQAQRFFDQGLVTKNDVLRFQLQRSNIELNGIELESNRKIINYNLNILLGLPESTTITLAGIPVMAAAVAPLQNYLDTAVAARPDVKQYDLRTKYAETNEKTVKANRSVTLAATAGAYYVDIAANPFPTSGNYITPVTLGATLSWNFSSLWTNKNKEAEAHIQRDQTVINKNIALDNVKNEVNSNYQTYLAAVNKINLLQTAISQATENNRLQESKYENNTGTATDRVDARTLLYQAQINLEIAKADAGLAYYNLIKSTGTLNK